MKVILKNSSLAFAKVVTYTASATVTIPSSGNYTEIISGLDIAAGQTVKIMIEDPDGSFGDTWSYGAGFYKDADGVMTSTSRWAESGFAIGAWIEYTAVEGISALGISMKEEQYGKRIKMTVKSTSPVEE